MGGKEADRERGREAWGGHLVVRMGKKGKKPKVEETDEACAPFGFKLHDLIHTPVGLMGTVVGAMYKVPGDVSTARLFVMYRDSQFQLAGQHVGSSGRRDLRYGTFRMVPEPLVPGSNCFPLEIRAEDQQNYGAMGYVRAHEGKHILRDIKDYQTKFGWEEARRMALSEEHNLGYVKRDALKRGNREAYLAEMAAFDWKAIPEEEQPEGEAA